MAKIYLKRITQIGCDKCFFKKNAGRTRCLRNYETTENEKIKNINCANDDFIYVQVFPEEKK